LQSDSDASLAYHALIEGEASMVMMAWLMEKNGQSFDAIAKNDLLTGALTQAAASDQTITPGTPRFFVETLKFPYIDGLKLCIEAYRRGGWKELDRMHARPPLSTREVLRPAEYFARLDRNGPPPAPFDERPALDVPRVLSVEHVGQFIWCFLL